MVSHEYNYKVGGLEVEIQYLFVGFRGVLIFLFFLSRDHLYSCHHHLVIFNIKAVTT